MAGNEWYTTAVSRFTAETVHPFHFDPSREVRGKASARRLDASETRPPLPRGKPTPIGETEHVWPIVVPKRAYYGYNGVDDFCGPRSKGPENKTSPGATPLRGRHVIRLQGCEPRKSEPRVPLRSSPFPPFFFFLSPSRSGPRLAPFFHGPSPPTSPERLMTRAGSKTEPRLRNPSYFQKRHRHRNRRPLAGLVNGTPPRRLERILGTISRFMGRSRIRTFY